jgi:hypothetical protein
LHILLKLILIGLKISANVYVPKEVYPRKFRLKIVL